MTLCQLKQAAAETLMEREGNAIRMDVRTKLNLAYDIFVKKFAWCHILNVLWRSRKSVLVYEK